jgi:hypothetical protein
MTAVSNGSSPAAQVSDRLPAGGHAEVRTRTRTREAPSGAWLAAQAAWVQRILGGLLAGESLVRRQSPTLAQEWARHSARARSHNAWLIRGPRYLWGVLHMPVAAGCDLAVGHQLIPEAGCHCAALYLIHQFI